MTARAPAAWSQPRSPREPRAATRGEPAGLGQWTFTKSTLAHARKAGVCQPTELADGRKATLVLRLQPIKAGAASPRSISTSTARPTTRS